MSLIEGLLKPIENNAYLIPIRHYFGLNSRNIKVKGMKNLSNYINTISKYKFGNINNKTSFKYHNGKNIELYHISAKSYSTNNTTNTKTQTDSDKEKTKRKSKVSKRLFTSLLFSSSLYFLYNVYGYYSNNISIKFQSRRCHQFIHRFHSTFNSIKYYFTLPYNSFVLLDKLQPVSKGVEKTLVLNLNKTLVSYNFSLFNGFDVLARPGLTKFIQELGKLYEIVIFSNEDLGLIEDIATQIDPKGDLIRFKLGKESMRYYQGKTIKDLSYLNRNLDNVIVVDVDPENVYLQQSNTIIIPEFNGNGKDRELMMMIVFLKDMAKEKVKNIRSELEKYGHYKPYLKYYSAFSKYKKLLPKTQH